MLQEKNNLSIEQITKECICSGCTEESTAFLAEPGKSVIRIMYSMSILVVLAMFSLIVNSLASGVVIQPARALENVIRKVIKQPTTYVLLYPKESSSNKHTGCHLKKQVIVNEIKHSLSFQH